MNGDNVLIDDETWLDENMKWEETDAESKDLRIGGAPYFTVGKEAFEWPHYDYKGTLYPLLFVGQLILPDDRLAYLFARTRSATQVELFTKDIEPYGGTTCGWVEGEPLPEWITSKVVHSSELKNLIHSEKAIKPGNSPTDPYWIQAVEVPSNHPYFLFQIDECPGELNLNENLVTYIYWNKKNEVVLFNQTY